MVAGAIRWTLRLMVLAAGVLVFLALLAGALAVGLLWGLRTLWARITGAPATPWAIRMPSRGSWSEGWSTVYRSTARWTAPNPARHSRFDITAADITDVVAREVR